MATGTISTSHSTVVAQAMSHQSTTSITWDNYDAIVFACTNSSTRVYGTTVIPTAFIKNGTVDSVYVYGGSTAYVAQFSFLVPAGQISVSITGSGIFGAVYGVKYG